MFVTGATTGTVNEAIQTQSLVTNETNTETTEELQSLTTKEYVENYFSDAPIMIQVARCESQFRQFDTEGKVLRGKVNAQDVGVMQINEKYHLDTAQRLGIDIYTLEGNLAYGRYLYETQGVAPWVYSSKCWNPTQVAFR